MRNGILITFALLGSLIVGCTKDELVETSIGGGDGQITFDMAANWTRGTTVDEIADVPSLNIYSFCTSDVWATTIANQDGATIYPYFTSSILTPFTLTQAATDNWSYEGVQYWPTSNKLSFVAHYPADALTCAVDDDGVPQFSYTLNPLSRYNDDLVLDARYDMTSDTEGGEVNFDLQHALTKLTLQVRLTTTPNADGYAYFPDDYDPASGTSSTDSDYDPAEYDSYAVNGIVFSGLYDNATLVIKNGNDSRTISWDVDKDNDNTISLSSTQGQTLLDVDDYELRAESGSEGDDDYDDGYTNIMMPDGNDILDDDDEVVGTTVNQAIFVLPQTLSSARVADIDGVEDDGTAPTAPTAMVRVRRTYYTDKAKNNKVEVIYETSAMKIKPADNYDGWEVGQHILMSFDFDNSSLSEYDTPLTISSEVLDWTPVEVTVDIHSNLYVYSSNETIAVEKSTDQTDIDAGYEYYGDFQICTNYDYNLRVPHHREELGGTITSSRGFLFCSDDFGLVTNSDSESNNNVGDFTANGSKYQIFVPTLLSGSDKIYYARGITFNEDGTEIPANFGSNTDSNIYEYKDGYGTTRTQIPDMTIDSIVYGSNGYAYIKNETTGLYRLLYLDPNNYDALTAFNYTDTYDEYTGTYTDDYHEIVLSNFADDGNTVNFVVEITDEYSFNFSVTRSTRTLEGLYTSTAISGDDNSYGVNKEGDDAVYTLRLSVNPEHLWDYSTSTYGTFNDIIGVEMISNGGGMITNLFPVELNNDNGVLPSDPTI